MADLPVSEVPVPGDEVPAQDEGKAKTRRRPRARKKADEASDEISPAPVPEPELEPVEAAPVAEEKPKRRTRAKKKADDAPAEPKPAAKLAATTATPEASNEDVPGEARRGWWQRTFG
jgi:ribonuclease E